MQRSVHAFHTFFYSVKWSTCWYLFLFLFRRNKDFIFRLTQKNWSKNNYWQAVQHTIWIMTVPAVTQVSCAVRTDQQTGLAIKFKTRNFLKESIENTRELIKSKIAKIDTACAENLVNDSACALRPYPTTCTLGVAKQMLLSFYLLPLQKKGEQSTLLNLWSRLPYGFVNVVNSQRCSFI